MINADPIRWSLGMGQDADGSYVSYHDYAILLAEAEQLRAALAKREEVEWAEYAQDRWTDQSLPPARKHVLVQIAAKPDDGLPPSVAVGYLRYAAGDKNSPVFTIPGVGGDVVAWCDCLPESFNAPLWPEDRY